MFKKTILQIKFEHRVFTKSNFLNDILTNKSFLFIYIYIYI